MASAPNPYAVTTLEMSSEALVSPIGVQTRRFRWIVAIILALMVAGTGAAWWNIYSIVFNGPVLFAIGLLLAVLTRSGREPGFRFLAWSCLSFPIFCFVLINILSWGPVQAHHPITGLCLFFTATMFTFSLVAWKRSGTTVPSETGFSDPFPPDTSDSQPPRSELAK